MFGQAKALMELKKIQTQLSKEVVEVEAGDGAVKIQISGDQKIRQVWIDPSVLSADNADRIQKWLESAISQAITKSQQIAAEKMKAISGGLGIPGL